MTRFEIDAESRDHLITDALDAGVFFDNIAVVAGPAHGVSLRFDATPADVARYLAHFDLDDDAITRA